MGCDMAGYSLVFGGDQFRDQSCHGVPLRTDCSGYFVDQSEGSVRWVPTTDNGFKVTFDNTTSTEYVVQMRSRWLERTNQSCLDFFSFWVTSDGEGAWVEFLAVNSTTPSDPEPLMLEKQVRSARFQSLPQGRFYFLLRAGRRIATSQTITIDGIWVYNPACETLFGGTHLCAPPPQPHSAAY